MTDHYIELKYRFLPGEYLRATRAHQRIDSRPRVDGIVSLLVFAAGLVTLIWSGPQYFWLGMIFVGMSLLLPLLYGWRYLATRSAVAENVRLNQELWLQFSDAGVHFGVELPNRLEFLPAGPEDPRVLSPLLRESAVQRRAATRIPGPRAELVRRHVWKVKLRP